VACRLAERTVAREQIDARHLLVALITPPAGFSARRPTRGGSGTARGPRGGGARAGARIESLGGAPLAGAIPRFFLSESDERKACEREIGPIGRLRQSFKQLDRLMAAQAEPK